MTSSSPLILAYHSISESRSDSLAVRLADFDYQMAWLKRHGYRAQTLAQYIKQDPATGERIVIITFDDGYADNYHLAFPVLKRYGLAATVFLVSDYVDTEHVFSWDGPKIKTRSERAHYRLLSWQHVQEMAAYGIEFGSHTCTHPELPGLPTERCREEIVRSRADLQDRLGCEIVSFCYPRGKLNADVIRMVEQAGYRCAVVTPGRSGIPLNRYTLRRVGVYHQNTPLRFRLKTTPVMRKNYEHLLWLRERVMS